MGKKRKLASFNYDVLDNIKNRSKCCSCGKSRMYFCYSCCMPVNELRGKLPNVKLPVAVDIIKHPSEKEGKSTAVHAVVLSPDFVRLHIYPSIPDYNNREVVIVYPSKDAVTIKDLARRKRVAGSVATNTALSSQVTPPDTGVCLRNASESNNCIVDPVVENSMPFKRLIFIDGTWSQAKKIFNDDRLKGIQSIALTDQETTFWRPQTGHPTHHLATIEAIHSALTSINKHFSSPAADNDGEHDDDLDGLLYFFNYLSDMVSAKRQKRQESGFYKKKSNGIIIQNNNPFVLEAP